MELEAVHLGRLVCSGCGYALLHLTVCVSPAQRFTEPTRAGSFHALAHPVAAVRPSIVRPLVPMPLAEITVTMTSLSVRLRAFQLSANRIEPFLLKNLRGSLPTPLNTLPFDGVPGRG